MQLSKLPVILPNAAQRAARPHEAQRITFLFREMPVDIRGSMKTVGEGIHQQSRRNTNVLTIREAIHRNADMHISLLNSIIR